MSVHKDSNTHQVLVKGVCVLRVSLVALQGLSKAGSSESGGGGGRGAVMQVYRHSSECLSKHEARNWSWCKEFDSKLDRSVTGEAAVGYGHEQITRKPDM